MPDTTANLYYVKETDNAVLLAMQPDGTGAVWIPRSLISYMRKDPPTTPGVLPKCSIKLPEWKAEALNLPF